MSIGIYINMLYPNQIEFLKYRYRHKLGNVNIAMNLNISKLTLSRESRKYLQCLKLTFESILN
ncbi:hypothetical protein DDA98_11540 [Clostridium perfringens]|uniref:hypothetical protein n=1 Tax=Clostridium perfringens TaxID=1502 RepID=UPI000D520B54|nr:hypothetical protein [Clostridium perfringens]PVE15075.1 hypothetical protein DDA98_11540 [Clostridium perfringens]